MPKEPNHHYIPIFYLEQWTDPVSRQLIEYCRRYKGVIARPTFPAGTGYVPGLYKLPGAPQGDEYIIETKLMSSIDNWGCACRKSNPDILVMQSTQDRTAKNVSSSLNGARYWCILVQ